jgi:hypothetical protein
MPNVLLTIRIQKVIYADSDDDYEQQKRSLILQLEDHGTVDVEAEDWM